jgi:hypothetical protein
MTCEFEKINRLETFCNIHRSPDKTAPYKSESGETGETLGSRFFTLPCWPPTPVRLSLGPVKPEILSWQNGLWLNRTGVHLCVSQRDRRDPFFGSFEGG